MSHITIGGHKVTGESNYSTTEQFTGKYWINGKKVYSRVLNNIPDISIPTANTNVDTSVAVTGATTILSVTGRYTVNYNNGQTVWVSQFPYIMLGAHHVCVNAVASNYFIIGARFAAPTVLKNFVIIVEYLKD